jgi:outer membrane protein assembly factor BamB
MSLLPRATIIVASVLATLPASSENWPEFRGPTGQGHSQTKNLPVEWSATKNVAWKQNLAARGWSSPIFFDGRLYLTGAVETDDDHSQSLRAICLDAKTGSKVWEEELFHHGPATNDKHAKNSFASPTPLLENGRIYVHFGHQGTACLGTDGKVIWRNAGLKYPPVHGNGGSPIIVDNMLIFNCDGSKDPFIVALDKSTGKIIWKIARESNATKKFSFCTPLLITVKGERQVISAGSDVVSALDPTSGSEIWRVRYNGYSIVPRPIFVHGLVYVSSGFDRPIAMAIRPDGRGDVTDTHVAWSLPKGAPKTPSMLVIGDELYMVADNGIMTCVDAVSGKVHWEERIGGNYSASPIYADGRIYIQSEEGEGIVVKPGKTFQILSRNHMHERSLASYAIGDGALFIRTEERLYRIQSAAN